MTQNIKYIMAVAAGASLLTSCNIYTKYQRPENVAQTDSLYRFIEATQDTTSIATLSWRELFTDPQLQSLIEQGLTTNTNLQLAQLNVVQSEAALKSARLAYLPSLNFTPQGQYTSFNNIGAAGYNIAASASWEIDIFGKLTNAKERSKAALEQSNAYRQAVQTQIISAIANSYYSLLMLDSQLDISRRTVLNWEDNLRVMEALKNAGNTNQTAVLQAQANKLALESRVVGLERQVKELENTLCALLGVVPQVIERGSIASQSFPSQVSVGLPIQLLSNRPDVRQAEYQLAQSFYATNQARSAFYPSLTLSGTAGFSNNAGVVLNPGAWLFNAVAQLVQPIFNRGALNAQLKISKAQQEQALLQFNQSLLDAGVEVNNALIQWQTAQQRMKLSTAQVEALKEAVTGAELLMKHSSSTYLDVLTAQYSLLQAELSEVSDKYEEIQGVINLYRSLGGGQR